MATPFNRDVVRRLRVPAYSFLAVTLVFQLFDYVAGQLPLQPASVVWRFAALGTASNIVGNVLLLALLIYALSLFFGDRVVLAMVGTVSALIAVALLSGTGIFALDMVQLRGKVEGDAIAKFDLASGQALIKLFVEGIVAAAFAISAFRANRVVRRDIARADAPAVSRGPVFRVP